MPPPPLYKYLDAHGAILTLENGTFKHAKPSDFNDTEDLTVSSIFPEGIEQALDNITNQFVSILIENKNNAPTCRPPMRDKLALIQQALLSNPDTAIALKAELNEKAREIYDVERVRSYTEGFIRDINNHMQNYRVFCASTHRASIRMWERYAENHKGISLRIEPSIEKDSKFQLFQQVNYVEARPSLYQNATSFIQDSLFGDQKERIEKGIAKIIYSKTLDWQYEGEYRLAIPMRQNENPWDLLSYHPEEITELNLGALMTEEESQRIIALAKSRNPNIRTFQATLNNHSTITFKSVE